MENLRYDWTIEELKAIYNKPLLDLVYEAATVHRENFNAREVQRSTLLSIKTGGCVEDCAYCPQAARYSTGVNTHKLLPVETVLEAAQKAKDDGSSRFCMGAAWREVRDNRDFDKVIDMVKGVSDMGLEVCSTLGMITDEQAKKLKDAGLDAYNHNLDTSEEYYKEIISTREYDNRLQSIENTRKAGITVCSGGIIGMGESVEDRMGLIQTLSSLNPHPESVPINILVPVEGTPLENCEKISVWEMVRMVATARIVFQKSLVRLSAGRKDLTDVEQGFCFLAGANSIFAGDELLTTPNPAFNADKELFETLGLVNMPSKKIKEVAPV
ncbi:MAG: biotin synthase BioB [Crocinitomicaceae bacterium]|nr:biotin synthase BioB [Crocinitomicaceae bacterium]|tara:strand:- start:19544 stop:20524 length:981 start_codon:yes stop_codon:yes gene_type:complete